MGCRSYRAPFVYQGQKENTCLTTGTLPALFAALVHDRLPLYIFCCRPPLRCIISSLLTSPIVLSLASVLFFIFWYLNSKGGHQSDQHRVPHPAGPLAGPPTHRRADVAGSHVSAAGGRDGYGEGGEGVPEDTLQQHQGRPRPEGETRHCGRRRVARCCYFAPTRRALGVCL